MPTRARLAVSEPGAPTEPQRTPVRIGISQEAHSLALRIASRRGFLAQEALEPDFVGIAALSAVPRLIRGELDVALIDLATFLGERVLGWDGLAIAVFGPLPDDRSCGVAVVEAATWNGRRDACDRLARSAARAIAAAGAKESEMDEASKRAGVQDWWSDCRPSAEELGEVARWEPGPAGVVLSQGLAWLAGERRD